MMSFDLKCEAESTQGLLKDVEYHRGMELSGFYSHGPAVWQFQPYILLWTFKKEENKKLEAEESQMNPWRINLLDGVDKKKWG